ncbi:hypothetical protein L1987_15807 [Smallanthus sonchifolius]|uniref:Uncharacterized protein n=1 Tax=Smallanthus sonchifolius TaxID=185202 RepID=A0ACB9JA26_9ASTR|nr:hypothetical protein L1987_15807 [Smallanthus sonchifolius]
MEVYFKILLFLSSLISTSIAVDTITANQSIKDGETIVSQDEMYELGFFSPGNSKKRYVGICSYGSCSINKHPPCSCIEGFEPKFPDEWNASDWSSGCKRKKPLDCGNADGFQKISRVKLPDTRFSWYNYSLTLAECEMVLLSCDFQLTLLFAKTYSS